MKAALLNGRMEQPVFGAALLEQGAELYASAVTVVEAETQYRGKDLAQVALSMSLQSVLRQGPGRGVDLGMDGRGFLWAIGSALADSMESMPDDVLEFSISQIESAVRTAIALKRGVVEAPGAVRN